MLEEIKILRLQYEKQGIIMSFAGTFSQGIIEEVGEALKSYVQHQQEERDLITRIFSVFIEMTQNIRNYMKLKENNPQKYSLINSSGIVVIGKTDNKYYLCSSNLMENSDIPALTKKLENVTLLDKSELKTLYKETLRNAPEGTISAGLGIIDMARKASEILNYKFEKKDDELSYFYLEVKM